MSAPGFTLTATIDVPEGISTNPALTAEHIETLLQKTLKQGGYWFANKGGGVTISISREVRRDD